VYQVRFSLQDYKIVAPFRPSAALHLVQILNILVKLSTGVLCCHALGFIYLSAGC